MYADGERGVGGGARVDWGRGVEREGGKRAKDVLFSRHVRSVSNALEHVHET